MSEKNLNDHPSIRIASVEELAQLPAVEASADEIFAQAGIVGLPKPATMEELGRARMILVAGKPVVGFARIEEVDGKAHLEQVSVLPEKSGKGIGAELIESSCKWASAQGYETMTLTTFRDIPWNAPFYASLGFEEIEELMPELAAHRKEEIELGLDELGPRIAMQKVL